jgi:hypothetical protein
MGSTAYLIGQVFGRLTVISKDPVSSKNRTSRWNCQCVCGRITTVISSNLNSGHTQNCGCLVAIHGMYRTPEYISWQSMKARCTNPNNQQYHDYGGRGIRVCDEWMNSFEAFYRDMGQKPSPEHTLDRKENNSDYEKNNCRWATMVEQQSNTRRNVFYEYKGEQLTLPEISRRTSVAESTLQNRINVMNLSVQQAVEYKSKTFV